MGKGVNKHVSKEDPEIAQSTEKWQHHWSLGKYKQKS